MDYKEIIKERLGVLPEGLKTFVLADAWRQSVAKIGKQSNFDEEKMASLENEVFLVLLCFSQVSEFVENLKNNLSVDENTARTISNYVNGSVFGPVMKDIKDVWAAIPKEEVKTEAPKERKDNIGESFEQAIINQAKAMRPALPPDNLPTNVAHTTPTTITPPLPPTPPTPKPEVKITTGPDPYREPLG